MTNVIHPFQLLLIVLDGWHNLFIPNTRSSDASSRFHLFIIIPPEVFMQVELRWNHPQLVTNLYQFWFTSCNPLIPYGANIRTNRMILLSHNITDNLFVQWPTLYKFSTSLAALIFHVPNHLTTFNFGTTGWSNKSIVCLNRSFFTNAA